MSLINDGSVPLADLGGASSSACVPSPTLACLIDNLLASGTKSGYNITWAGDGLTPSVSYNLNADPIVRGTSGRRSFYTNYPGVIRYNDTGPATVNDPAI